MKKGRCEMRQWKCVTCGSVGFEPSVIPHQCTFCDGTEGGNPPLMSVMVDGKPEQRPFHVTTLSGRREPELRSGEQVFHTVSGEVIITRTGE